MAEYINKEDTINFLKGTEALHYNDELRINILNGINAISSTADVVEREKIDKAIKEMERYSTSFEYVNRHDLADAVDYCIGVIQRNIGEE